MEHNKLADMRKRAGLTQQQLAEKIGVTQQTIWYYENGRREMKSSVLIELSKALGCSVSDLLGLGHVRGVVSSSPSASHRMPLVGRIAAGTPREAIYQVGETHGVPEELWQLHPNGFWLTVSGNSMNRLFADGTLVLIDPDEEVRDRVIDRSDPDAPEVRVLGRAVSYTAPDGWRA